MAAQTACAIRIGEQAQEDSNRMLAPEGFPIRSPQDRGKYVWSVEAHGGKVLGNSKFSGCGTFNGRLHIFPSNGPYKELAARNQRAALARILVCRIPMERPAITENSNRLPVHGLFLVWPQHKVGPGRVRNSVVLTQINLRFDAVAIFPYFENVPSFASNDLLHALDPR